MKTKSFLLMCCAAATISSAARTLTPDEALSRFNSQVAPARVGMATPGATRLVHTSLTEQGTPAAYVFNRASGGFLVLSANDKAAALLGYGDAPVAQDAQMPPQLVWWLGEYAKEAEAAEAAQAPSLQPGSYVNPAMATPRDTRAEDFPVIEPLLTTKWNQDAPYNNDCPGVSALASSARTYTGCVATAMAQVMKYHNYPAKGTGTGYATVVNSTGETIRSLTTSLAVALDWTNMLDTYTAEATTEQKKAVSTLMKMCGYAVHMQYSSDASASQSNIVPVALVDNFGYDKACHIYERLNYPFETWKEMIYTNLRDCGPVFYSGQAISGGHAFVCDGYAGDGYFHFNWGWGGAYDGNFRLNALEPEGQGIGGFVGGYNSEQTAVLGIRKPVEGSQMPNLQLTQVSKFSVIQDASRVTFSGGWANYNGRTITADIAIRFTPTDGSGEPFTASLGVSDIPPFQGFSAFQLRKKELATLANGKYKITIHTMNEGTNEWLDVLHPVNLPDFMYMTKNGGNLTFDIQDPAKLTAVAAELLTPLYYDCVGRMHIELRNDNDVEVPALVALAYVGTADGTTQVVSRTDAVLYDLMPGESATSTSEFTFLGFNNLTAGSLYTLVLMDLNTGTVIHNFGRVSADIAPTAILQCESFTMVGNKNKISVDDVQFDGTFTNTRGYYGNNITIGVFKNGAAQSNIGIPSETPLYLEKDQTGSVHFSADLSDMASPGLYIALPYYLNTSSVLGTQQLIPFPQEFTITFRLVASGIEAVDADEAGSDIFYNPQLRTAIVASEAPIEHVTVTNMAGAACPAHIATEGNRAVVDLSDLPAGIVVVSATDAAGNRMARKIAIR